jgi:hypothetical protein
MLHLIDRLVPLIVGEPVHAPIVEHAVVQPILVDRRQLVPERVIEMLDDLWVAFHGSAPFGHFRSSDHSREIAEKWRKTAENRLRMLSGRTFGGDDLACE